MSHDIVKRVLNARVSDVIPTPTPLDPARILSKRLGFPVLLKREDLTPVFSFKLRGAYNRIALLSEEERKPGVIASSAGNHAQGVAYSAQKLGVRCRIVMPRTTPAIKVNAVKSYGARVELHGDSYSDAAEHCRRRTEATGMTFIPPYDDWDVIAGQATSGLEILQQAPRDLRSVYVPIGGGGLAAGVAAIIKEIRPEVRIVGVEPDDADAMRRSLEANERIVLDHVGIFADGVAVKQVGEITFDVCREYVDEVVTVNEDEICAAIKDAFEDTRSVLEPAGALSVAGLKRSARASAVPPGSVVAIASGANINFTRLRYITERVDVGEYREAIFCVTIPERKGSFREFCDAIGDRSVTEFNYRLSSRDEAHIFVGVEVSDRGEAATILQSLAQKALPCLDLSDDGLAKTHVRHMVGGRTAIVDDEVLYSFEFPERPGALLQFLTSLGQRWNISLFHYRNHGAAFGRVLCGLEVPVAERGDLQRVLKSIGFSFSEESENPAARFFLR